MLAATLMRVKAKMLLPQKEPIGDELIEDPRQELVDQLINYQRFKSAAGELGNLAEIRSAYYPVAGIEIPPPVDTAPGEYLNDVSLFDLMSVFKDVLGRMPSTEPLRLKGEPIKLDDKVRIIRKALSEKGQVSFKDVLLTAVDRADIVVTFLAVLEMVKRKILLVVQSGPFGEIFLQSSGAEA